MQPTSPTASLTLNQRHQAALAIAAQCEEILRTEFKAKTVILFGSLAGDSPWHWDSDLDLAVAGLSQAGWLQAYDRLEAIMPAWLKLDLLRLETAAPQIQARIYQEKPVSNQKYLNLKEHLDNEIIALEKTIADLQAAIAQADSIPEDFVIRTLASYITDFYRRCERMSERVAVALDGRLPQGPNWHQALRRQVSDSSDRPALWQGSLLLDLDELRKFRHVVHHKYGDELKVDYVMGLAELAVAIAPKIRQAVEVFNQWLIQVAQDE